MPQFGTVDAVEQPPFACGFVDANDTRGLQACLGEARANLGDTLRDFPLSPVKEAVYALTGPHGFGVLPDIVPATFASILAGAGAERLGWYKKALVIDMIGDIDRRIAALKLPRPVLDLYPETLAFVIADLLGQAPAHYLRDDDQVARELRLVSLRSVPCGARVVDLNTFVPNTVYRYNGWRQNLRAWWFVKVRLGGLSPLYRPHLEPRCAAYFTEPAYTECYLRVAAMLRLNPQVLGVTGSSWLLDPQIDRISPHLAYVRRLMLDNGAISIHAGTSETHTARAIATSRTRRRLYEAGEYQPTCYTQFWARRDLLRWADRVAGTA